MLTVPTFILKAAIRRLLHFSRFNGVAPAVYRKTIARIALPVPLGVRREAVAGAVLGEWLVPRNAAPGQCILYLHGGAYVFGSPATHREFAGRLARLTGRKVFLLDYRLAPEHPFPAAQTDALLAFQWLVAQGYEPGKIAVVGDSAGGNLTLSLALKLRDQGHAQPAALVLCSPWTDLTCPGADAKTEACDPMIDINFGRNASRAYCGSEDPRHPHISPLFADLSGLPPILIHVGTEEILLNDSVRFSEKAKGDGVSVDLQVWKGMWHVWHLFGLVLPEARRAHRDIARFISAQP